MHASSFILGPSPAYTLASQSDPANTPTQTVRVQPRSQLHPYPFSQPPPPKSQPIHRTSIDSVRDIDQQDIPRREFSPCGPQDEYEYDSRVFELDLPPEHPAHLPAAAHLRICTPPPVHSAAVLGPVRSRKRQRSVSLDRQRLASMQGVIIPCTPPPEHTPCTTHPVSTISLAPAQSARRAGSGGGTRAKMEGMLGKYRLDPFATRWCNQHVVYQPPVEFTFIGTQEVERVGDVPADTVSCGEEDDHEEDDTSEAPGATATVELHSVRAAASHTRTLMRERSPGPSPEHPGRECWPIYGRMRSDRCCSCFSGQVGGDTVSGYITGQQTSSASLRGALSLNEGTTAGGEQRSLTVAMRPTPTDDSPTTCHYAAIHQHAGEGSADADEWNSLKINTANRPELGKRSLPASAISNSTLRRVPSASSSIPITSFESTSLSRAAFMDRPPSASSSMSSYDDSDAPMSDDRGLPTAAGPPFYARPLPPIPPQQPPAHNTHLINSLPTSALATSASQPQYTGSPTLSLPPAPPAGHQQPPTSVSSTQSHLDHQPTIGGPQEPPKKKVKKVKMHPCSICGKEFPRPSGLQTHMNVHSGARRKSFNQVSSIAHCRCHRSSFLPHFRCISVTSLS